MKRVWRLGIVAIFAAIGTGIAQTQTNNVPGIISDCPGSAGIGQSPIFLSDYSQS